ncbi:hypothetical protein [Carboxydocella sp. ULO1]|uniref:hypothetical protein n=1 Tax=Carboxydocella sp. ULO1 TaxID=1926599 RepID=UPI0009AE9CDB|nr:hypothetical protein [Carboxydocella sp. ULO1]
MILVLKEGRTIAIHTDEQEFVVDLYPGCEIIKVANDAIELTRDKEGRLTGLPEDPRSKGIPCIELKRHGSIEQRIADLEAALAALIGGGTL